MTTADGEKPDFFVSYSKPDEEWAEWIAWQLEEVGFAVTIQAWDFVPGTNFVREMHEAIASAKRTISVLSPDYLRSRFTQPEWQSVFAMDPTGAEGLLIPVRVRKCPTEGLLRQIVYVDFVDLGEQACRELLIRVVNRHRAKPSTPPPFPGGKRRSREGAPRFPCRIHPDLLHPRLAAAREELNELAVRGAADSVITVKKQEILQIRRELREGGRLRPRDELSGQYVLIEVIGHGGFATVWKAWDQRRGEFVALKILHPRHADDRTRVERFFRGARQMAKLVHPNIVRVFEERADDGGFQFFVMEHIDGRDLRKEVLSGTFDRGNAMDLISQIGTALSFAHSRGIIHRDVKPANVLLTRAGLVKLTDFDLARAGDTTGGTRTGALGTFIYAAPEAMQSANSVDEVGDVFSLGMTSLFILRGEDPDLKVFRDPDHYIESLPCNSLVKGVLRTCVAWEVERRFQSVDKFLEALSQSLVGRSDTVSMDETVTSRRRRKALAPRATSIGPARSDRIQAPTWHPVDAGYGAAPNEHGIHFCVYSRSATAMRILLYDEVNDVDPVEVNELDPDRDRNGDIWQAFIPGLGHGQLYHFQADGPYSPERGQLFDGVARLIDPYAQALAGDFQCPPDNILRPPKCVAIHHDFDWEDDRAPRHRMDVTIIYELHVRGFTKSETSEVRYPGTYLGVIEKIPYLKSLGVTAVELMPVHEFPILDVYGNEPQRPNYWGYDPMAFFAPHRGYAASDEPGGQVVEFKEMVKALHRADIEVILDVVFNHTCEGNEFGPTISFKGLENSVYYMLDHGGAVYKNYSGCGNTVNANHPIVREMISRCLRHWAINYHVDGFRFDLASILSRDRNGELMPNPPLVESIAEDPQLSDRKIIAEAWDAAGAYQVGSFANLRWAEWNGRFRDDVRRFWRGESGMRGALGTRFAGSVDLYERSGRRPYHSINFITSHDGFTLNDVVCYCDKHNEANGEGNRDGDNNNHSCNYGIEGPTDDLTVDRLRLRHIRNLLATALLSQGVPMLVAGDEIRRTQQGNNNAYCQDNETSWFDWSLVEKNASLLRFTQALINFRREQPTVRRKEFLRGQPTGRRGLRDVNWYNADSKEVDWDNAGQRTLICLLTAPGPEDDPEGVARDLLLAVNASDRSEMLTAPTVARGASWRLFIDTAADSPKDIFPHLDGPRLPVNGKISLPERTLKCFVTTQRSRKASRPGK